MEDTTMPKQDRTPRQTIQAQRDKRTTNEERVARATKALEGYISDGDAISAVCDFLADLLHYCDANGLDFAAEDRRAHTHYLAELVEEEGM
jgi:hypothetical protein